MALTQRQLEFRRTVITATDLAAILGRHPNRTELDVFLSKTVKGGVPLEVTERMLRGQWLEPYVAQCFIHATGLPLIIPTGGVDGTYQHPERRLVAATPDRFTHDKSTVLAIVELKSVGRGQRKYWGAPHTDEVPEVVYLQVHWQMLACDGEYTQDRAYVGVQFGMELEDHEYYVIRRNRELEEVLFEKATAWWKKHPEAGVAPVGKLDGRPETAKALAIVYPGGYDPDQKAYLEATDSDIKLAAAWHRIAADLTEREEELGLVKNQFREAIGTEYGMKGPFGKIIWPQAKEGKSTAWKEAFLAVTAGLPPEEREAIIAAHTSPRPSTRSLRKYWDEDFFAE